MSFLADFPVKTSAQTAKVQELKVSDLDYGQKWQGLSLRYDRSSCAWKTHQGSQEKDLPWSLVTLPKWGMAVSGFVYQHQTAVRPIPETGSGLWPTAKASIRGDCPSERLRRTPDLPAAIKMRLLPNGSVPPQDGQLNPQWVEWFMGWPIGWTELGPLEMDRFREWQQQHSAS